MGFDNRTSIGEMWREKGVIEELTEEALATKLRREGEERFRERGGGREVRSLQGELGELGKEREEENLGEKRMLGFEERREAEGAAEQAMGECMSVRGWARKSRR